MKGISQVNNKEMEGDQSEWEKEGKQVKPQCKVVSVIELQMDSASLNLRQKV